MNIKKQSFFFAQDTHLSLMIPTLFQRISIDRKGSLWPRDNFLIIIKVLLQGFQVIYHLMKF